MGNRLAISLLTTVFSLSLSSMACAAPEKPQVAPADASDGAVVEGIGGDIVVTASKREERLRDVPAAVTAVTSEKIDALGIHSMRDYQAFVPGLSQRDNGASGFGAVILRGLNTGPQQNTATTAFYLDEAATTTSAFSGSGAFINPDVELTDVERIEVLKGPQGTLYGANNLGGIIRVVSVKPDTTKFSGNARGEVSTIQGGNSGFTVKGSINAPLILDKLALRVTGSFGDKPGWTDNVGTGKKNANTGQAYGVRAALRATPTPDLTIDLWGLYQKVTADGYTQQDDFNNSTRPIYGRDQYSSYYSPGNVTSYKVVSGSVNYDLGPVTSISSVSYVKQHTNLDIDFTNVYVPILPALGITLPANTGVPGKFRSDLNKTTVDTRLVSKRLGPIEFIVGGFYTYDHLNFQPGIPLANKLTGQPLPFPLSAGLIIQKTIDVYKEYSGYGNLTFYFTDQIDIEGGIRYSHNSQDIAATKVGLLAGLVAPKTSLYNFSDNVFTYLGTLRWRPTSKLSFYARAASGYRPGGPLTIDNAPPGIPSKIDPDTVWNYEAGVKGTFFDNMLDISATGFRIDWKNIQLQGLVNGIQYQTNGGSAKIDGLELEVAARPMRGLNLGLNAGYTNARLKSINPAVSAAIFAFPGDRIPLTPRWTVTSTADYNFPIGDALAGTIGATMRYQSNNPTAFPRDPANNNLVLPGFTTFDLRGGIDFGKFNVQARVDNLFNKRALVSSTDRRPLALPGVATSVWAVPNRPRSYTLAVSAKF